MPVDFRKFAFTAGELSKDLYGRGDLEGFAFGYREGENVIVDWKGGLKTRPGTEFCEPLFEDENHPGLRLSSFSFNTDPEDNYLLVWLHRTLRFIQDGQYLTTGAREEPAAKTIGTLVRVFDGLGRHRFTGTLTALTPIAHARVPYRTQEIELPSTFRVEEVYSIGTAYTADVLRALRFDQFRDDVIITHREHPVSVLRRRLSPAGAVFNILPQSFLEARHVTDKRSTLVERDTPNASTQGGFQWTVGIVDKDGHEHPVDYDDGLVESAVDIGENILELAWDNDQLAEHYRIYASAFKSNFNEPLSVIASPTITGVRIGGQEIGFTDTLEWTVVTGATGYEISFGEWIVGEGSAQSEWGPWSDWLQLTGRTFARSFNELRLYRYRVRAAVGAIYGPPSTPIELGSAVPTVVPSFDPNLGIPTLTGAQVEGSDPGSYIDTLTWTEVPNASGYEIRYRVFTDVWGEWSAWEDVAIISHVQTFDATINRRREWEVRAATISTFGGVSNRVEFGAPLAPPVIEPFTIDAGEITEARAFMGNLDLLLNGREVLVTFSLTERIAVQLLNEIVTTGGGGYYFEVQSSAGDNLHGPFTNIAANTYREDDFTLDPGEYRFRYYIHEEATLDTRIDFTIKKAVTVTAPPLTETPAPLVIDLGALGNNPSITRNFDLLPNGRTVIVNYTTPVGRKLVGSLMAQGSPTVDPEINFFWGTDDGGAFLSATRDVPVPLNSIFVINETDKQFKFRRVVEDTLPVTLSITGTEAATTAFRWTVPAPTVVDMGTIAEDRSATTPVTLTPINAFTRGRVTYCDFSLAAEDTVDITVVNATANSLDYDIVLLQDDGAIIKGPNRITDATSTLLDTITLPAGDYRILLLHRYYQSTAPRQTNISLNVTVALSEASGAPIIITPPPTTVTLVARAGNDATQDAGTVVYLEGTALYGSGIYITHTWEKVSGPSVDLVDLGGARRAFLAPHKTIPSNFVFRYTVVDNAGASVSDEISIAIRARAANTAQTGKGPTTPIPADTDGYRFCFNDNVLWQPWNNRPGRIFTWANATKTLTNDPRQADILGPLNAEHLLWFRSALHVWEDIVDCSFIERQDAANLDLRVGYGRFTNDDTIAQAFGSLSPEEEGVFIGFRESLFNAYRTRTPEHELGHHLGLWHPRGMHTDTIMETLSSLGGNRIAEPQLGDLIGAWHLYGPSARARDSAPDAPANFSVSAGVRRNDLSWDVPLITGGQTITRYKVFRRDANNNVTTVSVTSTSYGHSGLGEHEGWSYWVIAENSVGEGIPTLRERSYTLNDEGNPIPPQITTLSWVDDSLFIHSPTGLVVFEEPDEAIPFTWLEGLEEAYIVSLQLNRDNARMVLGISTDANSLIGFEAGPHLIDVVEDNITITFVSGTDSITITGITDPAEPYVWTPDNATALIEWAARRNSGDRVTISVSYAGDS